MKSLLQEGSSVMKAIQEAWDKVGKPEEFSIKILKNEEHRFLGITWKNSVVVSISYDFAHHERRNNQGRNTPRYDNKKKVNHDDILEKVMRDTEKLKAETDCFSDAPFVKKTDIKKEQENKVKHGLLAKKQSSEKKVFQNSAPASKSDKEQKPNVQIKNIVQSDAPLAEVKSDQVMRERWTEPMIESVIAFLQDIFKYMDLQVPFVHKVEKLQLRITFEKPLCENKDQEYKVYTSLAFLMLQMVKREFKKKCKGYRVVFGLQEAESE